MQAMSLVTILRQHGYPVKLTIAGQVPSSEVLSYIKTLAGQQTYIRFIGDGSLVNHDIIMELALKADVALVANQPNPSNENCIPTKIYECLGLRLPMILQSHALWESITNPYHAAISINFDDFSPTQLWNSMNSTEFYTQLPGPEVTWESEARKIHSLLPG